MCKKASQTNKNMMLRLPKFLLAAACYSKKKVIVRETNERDLCLSHGQKNWDSETVWITSYTFEL